MQKKKKRANLHTLIGRHSTMQATWERRQGARWRRCWHVEPQVSMAVGNTRLGELWQGEMWMCSEAPYHPSSFSRIRGEKLEIQVQIKANNVTLVRQPSGAVVHHSAAEPLECFSARRCRPFPIRSSKMNVTDTFNRLEEEKSGAHAALHILLWSQWNNNSAQLTIMPLVLVDSDLD